MNRRMLTIHLLGSLLFLVSGPMAPCQLLTCPELKHSKPAELARYLEGDRGSLPQNCVLYAIERIGFAKYATAIPLLITYLDYPRPPDGIWHTHVQDVNYLYPAANALSWIGDRSVAPLLSVMAKADTSDLVRSNAGDVVFYMYSKTDFSKGVAAMMKASHEETDLAARIRLENAARYWASKCPKEYQNACLVAIQ